MTGVEHFRSGNENLSVQELTFLLEKSGIDVTVWGTGSAKTAAHLLKEIESGESEVSFNSEGAVARQVRVAWVDVLYFDKHGNIYQLYEDRQEYKDRRIRKRNLSSSLGEKFKPDEQPAEAAARALSEELGITSYKSLHAIGNEQTTHYPDSYPGLESHYDTHSFAAVIDDEAYSPEGYVEVQSDKSNYYLWKLIRSGV